MFTGQTCCLVRIDLRAWMLQDYEFEEEHNLWVLWDRHCILLKEEEFRLLSVRRT